MVALVDRFLAKVDIGSDDACWLWTGAQDGKGYGQINVKGRPVKAHRVSYQLSVGPIPDGLQLDHLCRVRHCVNPDHLEPVTARENALRGMAPSIQAMRRGTCDRGHTLSNAIVKPNGDRTCRTCENERQRRYYYARKAQTNG